MSEHDNTPGPGMLDFANPDLQSLILTYKHTAQLIRMNATKDQWSALTDALVAEHTPEQLANMLTGACTTHLQHIHGQTRGKSTHPPRNTGETPTDPAE